MRFCGFCGFCGFLYVPLSRTSISPLLDHRTGNSPTHKNTVACTRLSFQVVGVPLLLLLLPLLPLSSLPPLPLLPLLPSWRGASGRALQHALTRTKRREAVGRGCRRPYVPHTPPLDPSWCADHPSWRGQEVARTRRTDSRRPAEDSWGPCIRRHGGSGATGDSLAKTVEVAMTSSDTCI